MTPVVPSKVSIAGSNSSAVASSLPSAAFPPISKTFPFFSSVAVAENCTAVRLPVVCENFAATES